MKKGMVVVGFVLAMIGVTLLLNMMLQSPVWFRVLLVIGHSVLFAVAFATALTDGRGKS